MQNIREQITSLEPPAGLQPGILDTLDTSNATRPVRGQEGPPRGWSLALRPPASACYGRLQVRGGVAMRQLGPRRDTPDTADTPETLENLDTTDTPDTLETSDTPDSQDTLETLQCPQLGLILARHCTHSRHPRCTLDTRDTLATRDNPDTPDAFGKSDGADAPQTQLRPQGGAGSAARP